MTDSPRTKEQMHFALHERMLCGGVPKVAAPGKGTKSAQLAALGWRIVPIPQFHPAKTMWHDPKTGTGNPPTTDFTWARDWLVIPPDGVDVRAEKVRGRNAAIRWAWERDREGRTMSATTAWPEIDPKLVAVLRMYRQADRTGKRALLLLMERVAEKHMPMEEAALLYWQDRGLSEADARRVVEYLQSQPEGRWREMLD